MEPDLNLFDLSRPFAEASANAQEMFALAFIGETGLKPSEAEMVIRMEYTSAGMAQVISFRKRQDFLNPIASPSTITETPHVTQAFGTDHSDTP